jgi:UDP-MurNAc hydroxylase
MKVRYIYSACVEIATDDVTVLCDPWFTAGIYEGSWYQYPVLNDPIGTIGPVDIIYISHIHPDHYDPRFLRRYRDAHPGVRFVIGAFHPPYLANKMKMDGFAPEIVETLRIGKSEMLIVPNKLRNGEGSEIDSALVIRSGDQSVVNLNDNPFASAQIERILAFCPGGRASFALLPYSGAGPYPQTYEFAGEAALLAAGERKREQFIALFARYCQALNPLRVMPFAGKYYLGGKLGELNCYRGVPDAVEVARRFDNAIVLADGGRAVYDLDTGQANAIRTEPYDPAAIEAYLRRFEGVAYDYEREIQLDPDHHFPFLPLLTAAKRHARSKVRVNDPWWIVLRPEAEPKSFVFNVADDATPIACQNDAAISAFTPRVEIAIDDRYLFGLLTRLYHWNNAEVGSQYRVRRVPDLHHRDVYGFLSMLHV